MYKHSRLILFILSVCIVLLFYFNLSFHVFATHSLQAQPNTNQLTESNLDGAKITLTLVNDEFNTSLSLSDLGLRNEPPGLTMASITRVSNTEAEMMLAFNNSDFDVDYPNFQIGIRSSGVVNNTHGIFSNSMAIYAETTSVQAFPVPDELYENALKGSKILLVLTEATFGTVSTNDFTLNNAPNGISVVSVFKHNSAEVTLTLGYNGVDFDNNYTAFSVTVGDIAISSDQSITSNTVPIYALNEVEGQQSFYSTGQSYPSLIENAGYKVKDQSLYLNIDLFTEKTVNSSQQVTFFYYVEVFNQDGLKIGSLGDLSNPTNVIGSIGSKSVSINNIKLTLGRALSSEFRIVVTVSNTIVN